MQVTNPGGEWTVRQARKDNDKTDEPHEPGTDKGTIACQQFNRHL